MNKKIICLLLACMSLTACTQSEQIVEPVTIDRVQQDETLLPESVINEPETTVVESKPPETDTEPPETTAQISAATTTEINTTEWTYLGQFYITNYCSCIKCCGKWAENRPIDENGDEIVYTASGVRAIPNYSVAVDTSIIPFGTELMIDGHIYRADDRGGAVKKQRIDCYRSSHEEALNSIYGYHDVYIRNDKK